MVLDDDHQASADRLNDGLGRLEDTHCKIEEKGAGKRAIEGKSRQAL